MKHTKLFKYIFISSLAALAILTSACNKKKASPSAAEINESIAIEREKQEAEEARKISESKEAQQKEDQEKFRIKSEDEKLEESRQAIIESEAPALKQEALNNLEELYAVNSDDPEVIEKAEAAAKEKIEEGFDNLTPDKDPYAQMAEASDVASVSDDYVDLIELNGFAWDEIATKMLFSVTPNFGYVGYYKSIDDVYDEIDKTYANYSENVRKSYKDLAKSAWDEYTENNKKRASESNPWTLEELQEDDGRFFYSREEYQPDDGFDHYGENPEVQLSID